MGDSVRHKQMFFCVFESRSVAVTNVASDPRQKSFMEQWRGTLSAFSVCLVWRHRSHNEPAVLKHLESDQWKIKILWYNSINASFVKY